MPYSKSGSGDFTMTKTIRVLLKVLAITVLAGVGTSAMAQDAIRLRIASGHPRANTYVALMQDFFVPEITKRVAARTKYKVEFVEGYGGSMVKVSDTLQGVQSGIIDIGGYNFGFEPSNLPLHPFQVMLPFGTMDPEMSLKIARAVYNKVPYLSKVFEDKFDEHVAEAERRVPRLELLRGLEMADDGAVLGVRRHPVPRSRREVGRVGLDDGVDFGHLAVPFLHLGDLLEQIASPSAALSRGERRAVAFAFPSRAPSSRLVPRRESRGSRGSVQP